MSGRQIMRPASTLVAFAVFSGALALPRLATAQNGTPVAIQKDAPATANGEKIYAATCAACHQPTGTGLPEKYPPLAGSEWVTGDATRLLRIVLFGLTGDVEVQGETFSGAMPGWGPTLGDAEIAAVTSYVRSHFGNAAAPISADAAARVRHDFASRKTPWTAAELPK